DRAWSRCRMRSRPRRRRRQSRRTSRRAIRAYCSFVSVRQTAPPHKAGCDSVARKKQRMKGDAHLYLDVDALFQRGWTESLIRKYLGQPDRWETVNHWANFRGKRTYYLGRVETAEANSQFQRDYERSL